MPTVEDDEAKQKGLPTAASRSTKESNKTSRSVCYANEAICDESYLDKLEKLETCDVAPVSFCHTANLIERKPLQKSNSCVKGALENVADDFEPLPKNFESVPFNDFVLMRAKDNSIRGDEYKKSDENIDAYMDGYNTDCFYQVSHNDKAFSLRETSLRCQLNDNNSEVTSDFGNDRESGSTMHADAQRLSDFQRRDSKEIYISEATLVPDTLDAAVIPDEDIINLSAIPPLQSNVQSQENSCIALILRRRALVLGGMFMLLVITLSVLLTNNKDDSTLNAVPFTPTHESLMDIIVNQSDLNVSSFKNVNSYQSKALDWLVNDLVTMNVTNNITFNSPEIVERFALVVLYYAMNGTTWNDQLNFLGANHVCNWNDFGNGVLSCTSNMRIDELQLYENNLKGSLPSEISLLKELTYLDLGVNSITGFLPSFESLLKLKALYLNNNHFSGTIHQSLQNLKYLETLHLYGNSFNGKLIDVTNMTHLHYINFKENLLTGEVPSSYGTLHYLGELNLVKNDLVGTVDFLYPIIEKEMITRLKEAEVNLTDSANFFCPELIQKEQVRDKFKFDCTMYNKTDPKITCNSCCWCTFVSKYDCDPKKQTKIFYNISVGQDSNNFAWQIRESSNEDGSLLFAGGWYDQKNNVHLQMCLDYPKEYSIRATNRGTVRDGFNLTQSILSDGISMISIDALSSPGESNENVTHVAFSINAYGFLSN